MATEPVRNPRPLAPDYNESRIEGRANETRQGVTGQGVRYMLGWGLAAVVIAMILVAVIVMHG